MRKGENNFMYHPPKEGQSTRRVVTVADTSAFIENNFMYHPPKEGQSMKYELLMAKAKELAYLIDGDCPVSREKSLALTKLEEAVMWANASIARS